MSSDWYLKIGDKEVGPFTAKQLLAMGRQKQLGPDTPVRRGLDGKWSTAEHVKGLFDSPADKTPSAQLPTAKRLEDPPPVASPQPDGQPAQPLHSVDPPATHVAPMGTVLPTAQPAPVLPQSPVQPQGGPIPVAGQPPQAGGYPVTPQGPQGPMQPGQPTYQPVQPTYQPVQPTYQPVQPTYQPGQPTQQPVGVVSESPVSRATGSHGRSSAKGKRQRNNTAIMVGLVLLTVALVGGAVALLVSWQPLNFPADRSTSSDNTSTKDAQKKASDDPVESLFLNENAAPASASEPDASVEPAVKPTPPGESTWIDASSSSATVGPVEVKLLAAEVGKVVKRHSDGTETASPQRHLTLQFQLSTTEANAEIEYVSWSVATPGIPKPILSDKEGKRYRPAEIPTSLKVKGRDVEGPIRPDRSLTELLLFTAPEGESQTMHLELSAKAFGREETIRFAIPTTMFVTKADLDVAPRPEADVEPDSDAAADTSDMGEVGDAVEPAEPGELSNPVAPPDSGVIPGVLGGEESFGDGPIPIPGLGTGGDSEEEGSGGLGLDVAPEVDAKLKEAGEMIDAQQEERRRMMQRERGIR